MSRRGTTEDYDDHAPAPRLRGPLSGVEFVALAGTALCNGILWSGMDAATRLRLFGLDAPWIGVLASHALAISAFGVALTALSVNENQRAPGMLLAGTLATTLLMVLLFLNKVDGLGLVLMVVACANALHVRTGLGRGQAMAASFLANAALVGGYLAYLSRVGR